MAARNSSTRQEGSRNSDTHPPHVTRASVGPGSSRSRSRSTDSRQRSVRLEDFLRKTAKAIRLVSQMSREIVYLKDQTHLEGALARLGLLDEDRQAWEFIHIPRSQFASLYPSTDIQAFRHDFLRRRHPEVPPDEDQVRDYAWGATQKYFTASRLEALTRSLFTVHYMAKELQMELNSTGRTPQTYLIAMRDQVSSMADDMRRMSVVFTGCWDVLSRRRGLPAPPIHSAPRRIGTAASQSRPPSQSASSAPTFHPRTQSELRIPAGTSMPSMVTGNRGFVPIQYMHTSSASVDWNRGWEEYAQNYMLQTELSARLTEGLLYGADSFALVHMWSFLWKIRLLLHELHRLLHELLPSAANQNSQRRSNRQAQVISPPTRPPPVPPPPTRPPSVPPPSVPPPPTRPPSVPPPPTRPPSVPPPPTRPPPVPPSSGPPPPVHPPYTPAAPIPTNLLRSSRCCCPTGRRRSRTVRRRRTRRFLQ